MMAEPETLCYGCFHNCLFFSVSEAVSKDHSLMVEPDKNALNTTEEEGKPRKIRRSRTTFTTFQLHQLEQAFEKTQYPDVSNV